MHQKVYQSLLELLSIVHLYVHYCRHKVWFQNQCIKLLQQFHWTTNSSQSILVLSILKAHQSLFKSFPTVYVMTYCSLDKPFSALVNHKVRYVLITIIFLSVCWSGVYRKVYRCWSKKVHIVYLWILCSDHTAYFHYQRITK